MLDQSFVFGVVDRAAREHLSPDVWVTTGYHENGIAVVYAKDGAADDAHLLFKVTNREMRLNGPGQLPDLIAGKIKHARWKLAEIRTAQVN